MNIVKPSAFSSEGVKMNAVEQGTARPEHARHVCNICGKTSASTICEGCSERIRIEALARKKHEEQGDAWSQWE